MVIYPVKSMMQNAFNTNYSGVSKFLHFGVGGEQREGFGACALTEQEQGGLVGCREKGLEEKLGLWRGKRG